MIVGKISRYETMLQIKMTRLKKYQHNLCILKLINSILKFILLPLESRLTLMLLIL